MNAVLRGILLLPVYWISIHMNAIGVFAPGSFDQGDTNTPESVMAGGTIVVRDRYANWGEGRRNLFGLGAAHAARNWRDMIRSRGRGLGHHLRSFGYSWVDDYVKRGARVSSLSYVVMEKIAIAGWAAWLFEL